MEPSERSELIVVRTPEEKLEIIDERFSYPHQSGRNYERSYMGEVREIAASTLNLSEPDHAVSITLTRSDCAPTYLRNVMTFFVDGTTPFFMIKSVGDYYKKYIPEEAAKTIDIPGQDPEGWREISELRRPGQFKGRISNCFANTSGIPSTAVLDGDRNQLLFNSEKGHE